MKDGIVERMIEEAEKAPTMVDATGGWTSVGGFGQGRKKDPREAGRLEEVLRRLSRERVASPRWPLRSLRGFPPLGGSRLVGTLWLLRFPGVARVLDLGGVGGCSYPQ